MLDSHCHLDRFPDPELLASQAAGREVFIVAVTNLPSHFEAGVHHVRLLPRVRLALGLHPLARCDRSRELALFEKLLPSTTFIGEVGLDFSREGKPTARQQLDAFRRIAQLVGGVQKFVSIHSRGAERAVLEVLEEFRVPHAVFHWYTGPLGTLDNILQAGHAFSVNPAMLLSKNGQQVARRIPRDRLLTETDGPHVLVDNVPALPWHVSLVEQFFANEWTCSVGDVQKQVWDNFTQLVKPGVQPRLVR